MGTQRQSVQAELPRASSTVTVVRVSDNPSPSYAGRTDVDETGHEEAIHYVSVRKGVVLQGTIAELREFTGELGLAIAEVELNELHDQVQLGRRMAADRERRLA